MRPYEQLTPEERQYVDDSIKAIYRCKRALKGMGEFVPELMGDDRAERFADAYATWIIESRPKTAETTHLFAVGQTVLIKDKHTGQEVKRGTITGILKAGVEYGAEDIKRAYGPDIRGAWNASVDRLCFGAGTVCPVNHNRFTFELL